MNYKTRITKLFRLAIFSFVSSFLSVSFGFASLPISTPLFPGKIYPTGKKSSSIAVGDFNRDNKSDLAVVNKDDNSVSILLNDGKGSFSKPNPDFLVGTSPSSIEVGYFDKGDTLDLAVANSGDNTVSIFLGKGDGTFSKFSTINLNPAANPIFIAAGYFNKDGNLDLATVNNGNNKVSILLGNGDGSFNPTADFVTGKQPYSIAIGNFNSGDDIPDLAVVNRGDDSVSVFIGNGDGTFQPKVDYSVGGSPQSITVADLNGDKKLDLAVANSGTNSVSILTGKENNGDGKTFELIGSYAVGERPSSIAVRDFNKDELPDLAVTNVYDNTVSILLGNGRGSFQPKIDYAVGGEPSSITIGNFNSGDELADLAVANSNDGTVSILNGKGDGTFQTMIGYPTGSLPKSIVTGDFNGDNKLDLAVANSDNNTVSIFFGNGDGSFLDKVNYNTGDKPSYVVIGDFNADGKPDLAVVNYFSSSVSILLGKGDGKFLDKIDYKTGAGPVSAAVGDFNLDGKLDLAVANWQSNSISILLGNGDGSFPSGVNNYIVGMRPSFVITRDFNGDNKLDLAVSNNGSDSVSVLLGNGDINGTFQPKVNYPTGSFPESITAEDFNGDNKLDLAVANYLDGSFSFLIGKENKGDGKIFQSMVNYPVGYQPHSLITGDFNGDKILDLAVGNFRSSSVSILIGNGEGAFEPNLSYTTGKGPISIVAGDFNRDKRLDLAIASQNSNSVSVLLNQRPYTSGGVQWSAPNYISKKSDGSVTVTVTRTDGNENTITINYTTADGTAVAGKDYTATSGTLSWEDGDSADKTITIPLLKNGSIDTDKTIQLTLSNPTNGASLGLQTTAVILIPKADTSGDNSSGVGNGGSGGCQLNPLSISSQNLKTGYLLLLTSVGVIFLRRKNLKK